MFRSRLFKNYRSRVLAQKSRSIRISSAPRAPITESMAAMQTTSQIIYTEAPLAKLCDTLWMEKNVAGYKGNKREDILRAVLKKNEKKDGKNEQKMESLREMEKSIGEGETAKQMWQNLELDEKKKIEFLERMRLEESNVENCMTFQVLNQGISTGR